MAAERAFPVLFADRDWKRYPNCPRSVPWRLLATHDAQARRNHSQSLETLARRGGLDPREMRAVAEDREYDWGADRETSMNAAVAWLVELVQAEG